MPDDKDLDRIPKSYGLGILIVLGLAAVIGGTIYGLVLFNRYKDPAVRSAVDRFSPTVAAPAPAAPEKSYAELRQLSETLDLMRADIAAARKELAALEKTYGAGNYPAGWPDEAADRYDALQLDELLAMIRHDQFAGLYNAEMERTQYRYTRPADLPEGETRLLPRSYPPFSLRR